MKSLPRPLFGAVALAASLLLPGPASPAWAQADRWEPLGPYGGWITALTVAPGDPQRVFAGTVSGRVFHSADAGATWEDVTGDFPGAAITDVEVDPADPETVYAAACSPGHRFEPEEGGLFKTVDGGETWVAAEGLPCRVYDIAVDPGNRARVLAATFLGVFRSDDGGASWRRHPGRPGRAGAASAVAFDPATPGTVFVLHLHAGVLKSVNGGASWAVKNTGLPAERWRFAGLAFYSGAPQTLYLHASGPGTPVFRSLDGGESWSPAAGGLGTRAVFDLAVTPASGVVYAATSDGVFRSASRGRAWTAPAPGTAFADARVLAVPSGPTAVVYAGSTQSVFKSVDGGRSWSAAHQGFPGLPVDQVAVAPADETVLYARTPISGILSSVDGGATWRQGGPGVHDLPSVLAVHPRDPETAFAGGFDGDFWKTVDAGATWRRTAPVACLAIVDLEIDPRNPANLYAVGSSGNCPESLPPCSGLKSTDGGETWSCMAGLPREAVATLALAPSLPRTLYAGLSTLLRQPVLKSADAGRTWRPRSGGLPRVPVHGLAVSPEDARTVYALTQAGLYKSTDGAATWSPSQNGLPAVAILGSLTIAPSDPSRLYVAVFGLDGENTVIYHSTDAGAAWTPLSREGLPTGAIRSLQVSPTDPRTVYAATGTGIYKVTVAP